MICLTGDLHHMSLGTGNQEHCDVSEIRTSRLMLDRLVDANVKVNFFVSGKSFVEEWSELESVVNHPLVEVGGHNWSCFEPQLWHRVWNKAIGSYNGPRWAQRHDAERTIETIQRKTNRACRLWRNHMYMHGPNTESVLAESGIELCSDGTNREGVGPVWHEAGLYNFPINVIPDHEHLYHAERTPEWVAEWQKRYNWSDDWGKESYYADEWTDLVLADLERNEARGAISNMIIHPITMYLCDGFKSFERILDYLKTKETIHLSQALPAE
jgi:hypothetical protein